MPSTGPGYNENRGGYTGSKSKNSGKKNHRPNGGKPPRNGNGSGGGSTSMVIIAFALLALPVVGLGYVALVVAGVFG